jgi:hypothetical protein
MIDHGKRGEYDGKLRFSEISAFRAAGKKPG